MNQKTKSQLALYHLDMLLWVQQQKWNDKFIPVITKAREFRDTLAREEYTDGKD